MWTAAVQPIVIAVLVVLEVAVWQVRVALATRGQKRSAAMLPIPGTSKVAHLQENVGAASIILTDAEFAALDRKRR